MVFDCFVRKDPFAGNVVLTLKISPQTLKYPFLGSFLLTRLEINCIVVVSVRWYFVTANPAGRGSPKEYEGDLIRVEARTDTSSKLLKSNLRGEPT